MSEQESVYLGIDINDKYTMVSYYNSSMPEPDTISTVIGSESYQIPTFLAKRKGMGQWFFGREAKSQVNTRNADGIDHLYHLALSNSNVILEGESFMARDLMVIFIKKLLAIPGHFYANKPIAKIVFSVDHITMDVISLFSLISNQLGLSGEKTMIIDHSESFYYYALSQEPALFQNDVMLFDYSGNNISHCLLKRNKNTTPQVVTLLQGNHPPLLEHKDMEFQSIVTEEFAGNSISSVYLIGDGFDGDWMKNSLAVICNGRRVFLGKNLYSKGACYAGAIKDGYKEWPFVFIGDNELKLNLSIKVSDRNEMKFVTLINAGESWFNETGECEVVLDGSSEVTFWVQKPDRRDASLRVLELTDLPKRENRTTRLRIMAKALSDKKVEIEIHDLGFGEIVPSSNKVWYHTVELQ